MSMNPKRFTEEEAQAVIAKLGPNTLVELDSRFREGRVPAFEEIEGRTAGGWLAKSREDYWWSNLFIKVFLDSPWARWSGKGFITSFGERKSGGEHESGGEHRSAGEEKLGRGANLFRNRFRPVRYRLDTFIKKAEADDSPCLTLRYPLGSIMYGLIDDVRVIDDGVFLGQMYYKFLWRRHRVFIGYFVLCALK